MMVPSYIYPSPWQYLNVSETFFNVLESVLIISAEAQRRTGEDYRVSQ